MRISRSTIEEIDNSLLEIISHYVDLKRSGSLFRGYSPFNPERTPSFFVNVSKGIWKDFSSGKGGRSPIQFVQEMEGLDFVSAVKKCASILGIEVEYEGEEEEPYFFKEALESLKEFYISSLNQKAIDYLHSRGLTDESIREWEIGLAPDYIKSAQFFKNSPYLKEFLKMKYCFKNEIGEIAPKFYNRIMFPIRNQYKELVGFSGRDLTGKAKSKYINSSEFEFFNKSKILYGLDKIKKDLNKIMLVEGQIDVILAHQSGLKIAVAAQGTAFTQYHFNLIKNFNTLICFDGDDAGRKATLRTTEIFFKNNKDPKVAILPEGKDVADIITTDGINKLLNVVRHHILGSDYVGEYIRKYIPDEQKSEFVSSLLEKLKNFPSKIKETLFTKLYALLKDIELKSRNYKMQHLEEMALIKYIITHGLEDTYIEPFKDCYKTRNFRYNFVKEAKDLNDEEFYLLWKEFELSCYKKRIHKIKKSNLPYKEKVKQIKELEEAINATKCF